MYGVSYSALGLATGELGGLANGGTEFLLRGKFPCRDEHTAFVLFTRRC